MASLNGVYKKIKNKKDKKNLRLNNFSFKKSQKLLHNLKTSLSDEVIKERRILD